MGFNTLLMSFGKSPCLRAALSDLLAHVFFYAVTSVCCPCIKCQLLCPVRDNYLVRTVLAFVLSFEIPFLMMMAGRTGFVKAKTFCFKLDFPIQNHIISYQNTLYLPFFCKPLHCFSREETNVCGIIFIMPSRKSCFVQCKLSHNP